MYINLALGAVALFLVWLLLKKLLVREDSLGESPARILEEETAKRRTQEKSAAPQLEPLTEMTRRKIRPIAEAMKELHAALAPDKRHMLSWRDNGDSLEITMQDVPAPHERACASPDEGHLVHSGGDDFLQTLTVSWQVPDVVLGAPVRESDGEYVLVYSADEPTAYAESPELCVRIIAAFIVAFTD